MKKLLIFIIVLALVIAAPIVFLKYKLSSATKVNTSISNAGYQSAVAKSKVKITNVDSLNLLNLNAKSFKTSGKVNVNATFTNEEISSLISKANNKSGPIDNVKINFLGNGKLETSFQISKNAIEYIKTNETLKQLKIPGFSTISNNAAMNLAAISLPDFLTDFITGLASNASVYATGSLVKSGKNSVYVRIDSLQVGSINMGSEVIGKVEQGTTDFVNLLITSENGFSIEELRVENGKLHYKGTLPATFSDK